MTRPEFLWFNITAAIKKQVEAIEELARNPQPEHLAPIVGRLTQATGELTDACRDYQRALDPERYDSILEELKELGLTKQSADTDWLASASGRPKP